MQHARPGRGAESRENGDVVRVKLALTHEEIAQLIGASRETVTRTLNELRKQNVVELSGATLTIRNLATLQAMAAG